MKFTQKIHNLPTPKPHPQGRGAFQGANPTTQGEGAFQCQSELEKQIDKLVYALYNLNESEIKLIESK